MKNKFTQVVPILVILLLCLLKAFISQGQNHKVFEMAYSKSDTYEINKTYSKSTTIYPFKQNKAIFSLAITANVQLNNYKSFVRVIFVTDKGDEYLVLESSSIISDENLINFKYYSEETSLLQGVIPTSIKLEIEDATITIESISINDDVNNKKEESAFDNNFKLKKKAQDSIKIYRINTQIRKKGGMWFAGETSLSKMTYQEKKRMMGGTLSNLKGFEYYSGGIFDLSEPISEAVTLLKAATLNATTERNIVPSFDWHKRHGINWMTPVRDQGQGWPTCSSFARIGAVEAMVNLYWNQNINLDLSEQQLRRCSAGVEPYKFIRNSGVVLESCSPYTPSDNTTLCSAICPNPLERIRISGYNFTQTLTEDSLKRSLIKYGPSSILLGDMMHEMTLVGFGTINANDTIYAVNSNNNGFTYEIIPYSDIRIGTSYWIFKNSWGANSRQKGYVYLKTGIQNIGRIQSVLPPIYSLQYTENNRKCVDLDDDGYYSWGIGAKPTISPVCPIMEDDDDSKSYFGPLDPKDLSTSVNLPYTYSFESPSDLWVQSRSDNFDWYFTNSTSRITPNTGPVSAYDGSWYLLANAQYNTPNKTATIIGPSINLMNACNSNLIFNYHMFGSGMGSLALQLSTDGGNTWSASIWSVSGNQGDIWKNSSIDISPYNGNMLKFRFIATTVSSSFSSMAIDNIKIVPATANTNMVISTSQTWSDFRNICQNLVIQGSTVLTINGEVIMPDESLITIKNGSELVVDAGKIINSKVVVESGGKLTLKNNGLLIINNDDITVNLGGLSDLLFGEVRKKNN